MRSIDIQFVPLIFLSPFLRLASKAAPATLLIAVIEMSFIGGKLMKTTHLFVCAICILGISSLGQAQTYDPANAAFQMQLVPVTNSSSANTSISGIAEAFTGDGTNQSDSIVDSGPNLSNSLLILNDVSWMLPASATLEADGTASVSPSGASATTLTEGTTTLNSYGSAYVFATNTATAGVDFQVQLPAGKTAADLNGKIIVLFATLNVSRDNNGGGLYSASVNVSDSSLGISAQGRHKNYSDLNGGGWVNQTVYGTFSGSFLMTDSVALNEVVTVNAQASSGLPYTIGQRSAGTSSSLQVSAYAFQLAN